MLKIELRKKGLEKDLILFFWHLNKIPEKKDE